MVSNLVANAGRTIGCEKITSVHCSLDSTVALCWINGQGDWGEYRQFVSNLVQKIRENKRIKWNNVATNKNPADLGSRQINVINNVLWQHGPEWLSDQARWPPQVVPVVSLEAKEGEKAPVRVMVAVNQPVVENVFDQFLKESIAQNPTNLCLVENIRSKL